MITNWKTLILVVVAIFSFSSLCAAQTVGEGQIKALAEEAATVAAKWVKNESTRSDYNALNAKIRAMKYDVASVPLVAAYMQKAKNTPVGLFVVNRVTKPLWTADSEAARAALVDFRKMHQKLARYANPRKYNLVMPGFRGRMPPDAMMAALAKSQAQMEKNRGVLMLLKKRNREIRAINRTLFRLMVLSGETKEDKQLITLMKKLEASGDWEFIDVLEAITSNAGKLGPERAGFYYDELLKYGAKRRMKKALYAQRFDIVVIASKGGLVTTKNEYVGVVILRAVNVVARAAGKPEVSVPTVKFVEDFIKKAAADAKKREAERKARGRGRGRGKKR